MTDSISGESLSVIAGMAAEIAGPDPNGIFLYAEAERAMVSTSLFKDMGEYVQYFRCGNVLPMKVLDLWYAAEKDKKWAALFLTIDDDKFVARFQYPEEWGEEDQFERRQQVVAAKYGNKHVRYPSLEGMGQPGR